jgi:hypothetical protein
MSAENPSSPTHEAEAPAVTNSRRRLLRVGAGSAPILLTLLSRPVLGVECGTASAVGSSLHSSHSPQISSCSGLSVSSWTSASTWPDPYKKRTKHGINGWDATPFHCTTTGLNGTVFSGKVMLDVMKLAEDGAAKSVGRYCAAALLNARSNRTPVLTEATVRNIWHSYVSAKGYYEPTAGVHWGATQIIAYIKSTMV